MVGAKGRKWQKMQKEMQNNLEEEGVSQGI